MTRRTLVIVLLVAGLALGGILGVAACTREVEVVKEVPKEVIKEVIKEVPKEVIKEVPKEVIKEVPKEVIKEVPLTVSAVAEKVQKGEIDVGKDYGVGLGQRYHKIHTETIGLACTTCHLAQTDEVQGVFLAQDVSPNAPGPVDKRACLGCHRSGPAFELYGQGAP